MRGAPSALPASPLESVAEPWLGGGLLHALEVLRGVGPEVEVELRDDALDDAPHRLAEVGHEAHEVEGSHALGDASPV